MYARLPGLAGGAGRAAGAGRRMKRLTDQEIQRMHERLHRYPRVTRSLTRDDALRLLDEVICRRMEERQAEAFEKFGQAAVLDIVAKMLPELAGKVAAPLGSIDKLTVVDSGNGTGALQLSQYVTQLMATAPEMLKNVSGIDVTQLVRGLTEKQNGSPAKQENAENKDKKEV